MASPPAVITIGFELFIGQFAARDDAYVLDSHEHVGQRLDPDLLVWAYRGGHCISGYTAMNEPDDSAPSLTTIGVVDLDEGGLDEGRAVRDVLKQHGIPSLLVASRRGAHVWTWHHDDHYMPVPSGIVRRALTHVTALAGVDGPKAEVFPKASASPWGCGAVRFPLMPHPKTGIVYPVYTMEDETVASVPDLINVTSGYTAPWAAVKRLAQEHKAPVEYPRALGAFRRPTARISASQGVVSLLAGMGVQARTGHTVRCPFHEDRHGSLSVAADDQRAWCKAPHCDLYNNGRGMGSIDLAKYLSSRS